MSELPEGWVWTDEAKRDPRTGRVAVRVEEQWLWDAGIRQFPEHWRYADNPDQTATDTDGWSVVVRSTGGFL
ncbi:type I restriction enzyme [Mycobacterium phage Nerujay]|uniref:restriction enzyme I n=1 Tax=Mycobacterium phage Nerujay TaxID=1647308 RepID=UPI00062498BD|nr:restriction enzyme I [Mycobacterium phage Nerujay]AKF14804.1 type I restriction enzyme [Mycobacterium phage Nerujay]AXH47500.1 hypothetical protein SEA_HOPE4EVER_39 [Mycobacterium phage Hope4ever]